jgi:chloramphenicol 3-O-phosphotransferase
VTRRTGLVFVLDGPSSVGKTTTIHALQRRWTADQGGPLIEAGLDRARAALGPGARGRWADLVDRIEPSVAGRPDRFRYGPLGRELVAGMHRTAAAWARAGFDVAVDHVILDVAMRNDLEEACHDLDLVVVGMTCDPVVLEDREAERIARAGDVTRGRALAQAAAVLEVEHEYTVDTTASTTDELVDELLALVARLRRA